jgi:hypothetical protein
VVRVVTHVVCVYAPVSSGECRTGARKEASRPKRRNFDNPKARQVGEGISVSWSNTLSGSIRPYNVCKGERLIKPQGYRHSAAEAFFCLFVLCLPYWQSLLLASISGTLSVLLMTCLLMFAVARSPEIYRTIAANLRVFPPSWLAPLFNTSGPWVWIPLQAIVKGPSLAPAFQRPPPIFS